MPPGREEPLPSPELDILKRWIDEGAPYPVQEAAGKGDQDETWWSFRKPRRPAIPSVKHQDVVNNPIDAFVLAKWEHKAPPHHMELVDDDVTQTHEQSAPLDMSRQ